MTPIGDAIVVSNLLISNTLIEMQAKEVSDVIIRLVPSLPSD